MTPPSQSNKPSLLRFSPALLALLIVLPPGLNLFQHWLHNPLYGFGFWVPLLGVFLIRERLTDLPLLKGAWYKSLTTIIFLLYFAGVAVVRLVQVANPEWRMLDWLLAGGAVVALLALAYRVGGTPLLKWLWFPICFLLTAVPWASSTEESFVHFAVPASATVASEVLWKCGIPAVDQGRILYTALGPVEVSEDCSGIRSLYLVLMSALFWTAYFRLGFFRGLALLVAGLGCALLFNLLRIVGMVSGAVAFNRIAIVDQWHDPAGMIAQISLVLALPGGALLLRNIWPLPVMKHSQERPPVWPEPVEAPLELPWVAVPLKASVMVLCWLVASAVAIEAWYRMHESTAGSKVVHWKINRQPAISGVKEQPISVAVRKAYRYSDALALDWKSGENLKWSFTWLDFDKGAQSSFTFNIHRPEVCLPSAGFTFAKLFPPLELNIGGQPLSFEHHIYERQGQLLNLFTVTIRDIPSLGDTVRNDWSVDGRLNAAMGGLRSRRSELIHLVVEGASDPRQIRAAATAYLKQIINYE